MNLAVDRTAPRWLDGALDLLGTAGIVIVPGMLSDGDRQRTRLALARAADGLRRDVGEARLVRAAAGGGYDQELRLPMKYDPHFYSFLECPELLAVVDRVLSPSAVMRFQNGMVIRPGLRSGGAWHMNFRRVLNGYPTALEIAFTIDDIDGSEFVYALGSHQRREAPGAAALDATARPVAIPAGAMLVFDSTLWHRQGEGCASAERALVAHQFTRHFVKPQFDYVRALGEDVVRGLPERTRRLLGWESRVPASLDEFYTEPGERRYLPDQG